MPTICLGVQSGIEVKQNRFSRFKTDEIQQFGVEANQIGQLN